MEVWTTEPGLQFYTGNFLDGTLSTARARPIPAAAPSAWRLSTTPILRTSRHSPTTELKPGETYKTTTLYRFSAR